MTPDNLDALLARWAAHYRLSEEQVEAIRASVLSSRLSVEKVGKNHEEIDPEWLWDLLRPVTRLLDGPHPLIDTLMRGYA